MSRDSRYIVLLPLLIQWGYVRYLVAAGLNLSLPFDCPTIIFSLPTLRPFVSNVPLFVCNAPGGGAVGGGWCWETDQMGRPLALVYKYPYNSTTTTRNAMIPMAVDVLRYVRHKMIFFITPPRFFTEYKKHNNQHCPRTHING